MPDRFTVASGACQLAVRSYVPAVSACPGAGVVLVHGLLSSADVYDVPGLESISLARRLRLAGIHAVSYDQRGTGESTTDGWRFGLHEHALIDLPAVLAACRTRLGFDRIVLLGHSLGGTIWLRYLQSLATSSADSSQPRVIGGVALASPADFDRGFPPWSDIARRGRAFVESIDHNRDRIVAREEFVAAQVWLYWPWLKWLFLPSWVRAGLRAGAASAVVAGVLRRLPIPSLIYDRDDFDNVTFQRMLQSKTLDRASQALLLDVAAEIFGPAPAPSPVSLNVLCMGSALDRLVPFRTVERFGRMFTGARVVATENVYGQPCGHVGYFFKAGLRESVATEVVSYVKAAFG